MDIEFVGGATASKAGGTSGNSTIALSSGLTGGIASAVAEGDLVIAAFGTGSTANRTLAITDGSSAYTLIGAEQYSDDTFDTNLRIAYKFMGATPDASTTFGPTGNGQDAGAMAVYVFRGVDPTTPLDVAAVQATGINTSRVVPPDITPVTAGAYPVVIGAAAHNGAVDTFTSGDLTDFMTVGANDTNDVTLGIGHDPAWSGGATNYATWGHSQADSTSFSWAATTIALRPAADSEVSGSGTLAAQGSGLDGTGVSSSTGTGALSAAVAAVDGAGASGSAGAGALESQAATLTGEGSVGTPAITGTGALASAAAGVDGAGESLSIGAGTLQAQAPAVAGAGTSSSDGGGTLLVAGASVEGAGVSGSTGTGVLEAGSAQIAGGQVEQITGAGDLVSSSATVQGAGYAGDAIPAAGGTTSPALGSQATWVHRDVVGARGRAKRLKKMLEEQAVAQSARLAFQRRQTLRALLLAA